MAARFVWGYQSEDYYADGEVTVVILEDGSAAISVEQEHALDSYNADFTCSVLLPPDKVAELSLVLAGAPPAPTKAEATELVEIEREEDGQAVSG